MLISRSSVRKWSHRALTMAVETGSRLLARVAAVSDAAVSSDGGRPAEPGRVEVAAPVVASGTPQLPPGTSPPTVAGARETAATGQHPVPERRAASASVTPAMVRRWAYEQGIQVADRGRIPQSLMEQYLAQVARPAAGGRQPSRAPSKGARRSAGRSHSSAA